MSGLSNSFPFQYQGLEHEVSDPGNLYFNPSGNVYNPQIQRGLSQVGQQSWGGPPNGDGFGGFGPGHHGAGPQSGMSVWQDVNEGLSILDAAFMFQRGAGGEGINFRSLRVGSRVFGMTFSAAETGSADTTPDEAPLPPNLSVVGDIVGSTLTQASKAPEASGAAPSNVLPLQGGTAYPPGIEPVWEQRRADQPGRVPIKSWRIMDGGQDTL